MKFSVQHIAGILKVNPIGFGELSEFIEEIVYDTRKIIHPKKCLFVALSGEFRDGHQFIEDAHQKGVRVFIASEKFKPFFLEDSVWFLVNDPLKAIQTLAINHRNHFSIPIIGITGSNGKTVVKEWLYELLKTDFSICRSPRSFNSQLGVAISVLQLSKSHELAIFEAGISQLREMEALAKMIQPNLVVITHLGSQHDAGFTNRLEKAKEKLKLCQSADVVVYPADIEEISEQITALKQSQPMTKFISWGTSEKAQFRIESVERNVSGQTIVFKYRGTDHHISIPFFDAASVHNAMSCFSVLFALERWDEKHIEHFMALKSVEHRLTIEKGKFGNVILNDSYSNDYESLAIALDVIKRQQPNLEVVAILTEMDQIGNSERMFHLLHQKEIAHVALVGGFNQNENLNFDSSIFNSVDELIDSQWFKSLKNKAILVKGARKYRMERVVERLKERLHKTFMEIDLEAIKHNYRYFKRKLYPETKMMCMVKAFGYGSGTFEVSKTLEDLGVDYLGVAYADEGVALRQAGIQTPIMVMNTDASTLNILSDYKLEPVVYNFESLEEIKGLNLHKTPEIHIEIDTGMHRLGFQVDEILNSESDIFNGVKVLSVFSHLAASESSEHNEFTKKQASDFFACAEALERKIGYQIIKHISNSAGIERYPEYQGNMVRLGIGLYGLSPDGCETNNLQSVASLYTTITQIHVVKAGSGIGYGQHDIEPHDRRIATIAMGYADGLLRRNGRKNGLAWIHGNQVPFVGNICMDMAMLDVTTISCSEGDTVEIFGRNLSINEMARRSGTISYEILTGISQRVPRIYLGEN